MIGLFKKELRALVPVALFASLVCADIFERPFFERLDETTWSDIVGTAEPGKEGIGAIAFVLALIAFSVAYAAFVREHDERTIEVLYSLPIRRRTIFVTKVSAGLSVLFGTLLLLMASDSFMSAFNTQSISGRQWRLDLALEITAIHAFFYAVVYAHGLLASVFRLFGLIPYALLVFCIEILDDHLPFLAWVNPVTLVDPQYRGRELVFPIGAMVFHSIAAFGALVLAYFAWMGPAEQIGRAIEALRATLVAKAVLGCGAAIGILFIGLIALALIVDGPLEDEAGNDVLAAIETEQRTTEHYVFTYPVTHRERALTLIAEADALHESIGRTLRADSGPQIAADLTEVSREHLGIAAWTHIRVGIATEPNPMRLRRTFAHETVHAFQHRLSDRRQGDAGDSTRFFAEGSAEYIAYVLVPEDAGLLHARTMAAAAWERHRMDFDELVDDRRLRARFDETLVYSLGEIWTAALVETHGEDSIGNVLRALGRTDAPRGLAARALWEDTLRAAGGDLESVDAAFVRRLSAIAEEQRATIDALPRIGGGVAGRDGGDVRIVASLDREPEAGWGYWVRVRLGPDAGPTDTIAFEGFPDRENPRRIVFRVPAVLLPGPRFQLLFAIETVPAGWMWSESWQWASAPR